MPFKNVERKPKREDQRGQYLIAVDSGYYNHTMATDEFAIILDMEEDGIWIILHFPLQ